MQLTVPGGESTTLDGEGDDMGGVEIGSFLLDDGGDAFFVTPVGVGVAVFVLLLLVETGVDEDARKNDSLTPVVFELDGTNPAESGDTRAAVCCNGVVRL